jgi:hypothetical protein
MSVEYVWSLILLMVYDRLVYKYVRTTPPYALAFGVEIQVYYQGRIKDCNVMSNIYNLKDLDETKIKLKGLNCTTFIT